MTESSGTDLHIQENVPLAPHTTFGVGGSARYFFEAKDANDVSLAVAWAKARGFALFVLGGGSNLLVPDEGFAGLVLQIGIPGLEHTPDGLFTVGAGVVWDELVNATLAANCAGVECLAGIPGSVGGTPVQNVGAYGQEVAETIVSVRAYDRTAAEFIDLSKEACRFRYRASLFNTDEPGRCIVTQVSFQLRPDGAPTLRYADLARCFAEQPKPALQEVAAKVREIRRSKGMLIVPGDPDCRSAGSFFKNPVVPQSQLSDLAKTAAVRPEDVPNWPAGDGMVKLPAAWLLERAGFVKGYGSGPVRISSRHTLALTNRGGARYADIEAMEAEIVAVVRERFGITLHREPVLLA